MIYGVGSSRGRGEGKTTPRSDDVKGQMGQMGSKEKGGGHPVRRGGRVSRGRGHVIHSKNCPV